MAVTKGQMTGLTNAIWEDMNNIAVSNTTGNTITMNTTGATVAVRPPVEMILDRYSLNELTVEHRVQEFELMKLRESNVDYATEIKRNLSKYASEEVTNKMTFTKRTDQNTDTHSFRGRVWVFSKEELIKMIEEIRNGI
jgi:hypothetical protein